MRKPASADRPEPTDAELAEQAKGGDRDAFGALVRRYQGLAIARAYALVGDRAEAEDVAQEAFMRAFRSLHQLRQPAAFGAWLLRTVSNAARRTSRRRSRRPGPLPSVVPAPSNCPRIELLDAIGTLPETDQQVLHLHYHQGCSCAEIARLLGLQIGSVTSRLTRARRKLRTLLSEDEE